MIDYMLWTGDFNRHHSLWDYERNSHLFTAVADKAVQIIISLIADYDMAMPLSRGINMLQAWQSSN